MIMRKEVQNRKNYTTKQHPFWSTRNTNGSQNPKQILKENDKFWKNRHKKLHSTETVVSDQIHNGQKKTKLMMRKPWNNVYECAKLN